MQIQVKIVSDDLAIGSAAKVVTVEFSEDDIVEIVSKIYSKLYRDSSSLIIEGSPFSENDIYRADLSDK